MTKLRNMFGLFVLVCALCFIPNVYAEEIACEEDTAVAQVGGKCYTDLKEAILKGGEVTVLKDTNLKASIVVQNEVTLNLNGKTVTVPNDDYNQLYSTFYVYGGTLKIIGEGTITDLVETPAHAVIGIIDGSRWAWENKGPGHIVVGSDVVINASNVGIMIDPVQPEAAASTIDFAGKITMVKGSYALYINGQNKATEKYPVITVRDGAEISSESLAIYQAGYSEITIGKATVSGYTGIATKSGKLTLNGTTVTGKGAKQEPEAKSGEVILTGSAIQVESNSGYQAPIDITITDGNFTSLHDVAFREYTDNQNKTTVGDIEISGGTFEGAEGSFTASENFTSAKEHFISGGTFTKGGEKDSVTATFLDENRQEDGDGNVVPVNVTLKFNGGVKNTTDKPVDYNSQILAQLADETVEAGANYAFDGWYYDAAFTDKVDENDVATEDMTLYARFVVTVTLDGVDEEPTTITKGTKFTKPTDPTKEGYAFKGWYTGTDYKTEFDFDSEINENTTIYAYFVEQVKVTFVVDEEETEVTQDIDTVVDGTKIPGTEKEGYVFQGWYTDSDYQTKFDITKDAVGENITLYAKFAKELGITVKGEEGTFDSLEGETYADFEEQLADIIEKLETEAEEANKHFGGFYYEDEEGNPVYVEDETILTEDIELVPYYVVEITIGEEIFTQEEELTLGEIVWSQFDNVEGKVLSHFVDEKGNKYTFESQITEDITLTPVYVNETEIPNTLDNVTSTAMMTIVGFVTMLVAGVLAIKSRKA